MPKTTNYVRDEDWKKYLSIEDRARWLHDAIRGTDVKKYNKALKERKEIEKLIEPAIILMKRGEAEPVARFEGPLFRNKRKGKL